MKEKIDHKLQHDLRGSIKTIRVFLDLIKDKDYESPQEYQKYLEFISKAAGKLSDTVENNFLQD